MEGSTARAPAPPPAAAVLGSRSARRQVNAVLAMARDAGAYSVGFALMRGSLSGFTVYFGCSAGGGFKLPVAAASEARAHRPEGPGAQGAMGVQVPSCPQRAAAAKPTSSRASSSNTSEQPRARKRSRGSRGGRKRRKPVEEHSSDHCAVVPATRATLDPSARVFVPSCPPDPPPPLPIPPFVPPSPAPISLVPSQPCVDDVHSVASSGLEVMET